MLTRNKRTLGITKKKTVFSHVYKTILCLVHKKISEIKEKIFSTQESFKAEPVLATNVKGPYKTRHLHLGKNLTKLAILKTPFFNF